MARIVSPFLLALLQSLNEWPSVNWKLYNLLLHIAVALLNSVEERLCQVCEVADADVSGLAEFEDKVIDDSECVSMIHLNDSLANQEHSSAYEYAEEWLTTVSTHTDVQLIMVDLESHQNIEQDFPARAFLDHVIEISQVRAGEVLGEDTPHLVLAEDLERATEEVEESLAPLRVKLSHRLNNTVRPKRRSHSVRSFDAR